MKRCLICVLLMSFWGHSQEVPKEHRHVYFSPIERYGKHTALALRISEDDFLIRGSMAQSFLGRHSFMVREHLILRTFGRTLENENRDEEIRLGMGMSLIKYFHTRWFSLYGEGGIHYTFGWYLSTSDNPKSQWLPDYSVGLGFPIGNHTLFQLGAQYMPLGLGDDWKLETGFVWGY